MIAIIGRVLRGVGNLALWLLAVVGVLCGGLWVANVAGVAQPLIVVSGSMTPAFVKGDLLLATPTPATDVAVGEVASLPNPETGVLVSHRITAVRIEGDTVTIEMKGDANRSGDPAPYVVSADDSIWQPVVTIPGAGAFVETLMRPTVAMPLAAGLVGLIGLTLIPKPERDDESDDDVAADSDPTDAEVVLAR
ncbi:signal peptidase I [Microbacterium protaetiae]|uniref:Signal peptidase I n=1 Tax=Microbacterium protaetiae TaxID=2509458 RepID=A0A4P6EEQ4_9MICO|nr:signal peptidase I [Microbacterium protaetiae]QAY58557.1 signal peptidase I [Microbacterium protaetiae]